VPGWRQLRGDLKRGTAAAVIFCDLDHLKYFNYENAPSLGDELLRRAATILSSRSEHAWHGHRRHAYRIGGDEFMIRLPGSTEMASAGYRESRSRPFKVL